MVTCLHTFCRHHWMPPALSFFQMVVASMQSSSLEMALQMSWSARPRAFVGLWLCYQSVLYLWSSLSPALCHVYGSVAAFCCTRAIQRRNIQGIQNWLQTAGCSFPENTSHSGRIQWRPSVNWSLLWLVDWPKLLLSCFVISFYYHKEYRQFWTTWMFHIVLIM